MSRNSEESEELARIILQSYFPDVCSDLMVLDNPDLQDCSSKIGVEVVRDISEEGESEGLFEKYKNSTKEEISKNDLYRLARIDIKDVNFFEQELDKINKSGEEDPWWRNSIEEELNGFNEQIERMFYKGKLLQPPGYARWMSGENTLNVAMKKISKLNRGNYGNKFEKYGLFVHSRDVDSESIHRVKECIKEEQRMVKKKFDYVFIYTDLHILFIIDFEKDIVNEMPIKHAELSQKWVTKEHELFS